MRVNFIRVIPWVPVENENEKNRPATVSDEPIFD
jgi:hypothetical protein